MNHLIKCVNCSWDYAETRKPCTGPCGHSICVPCARKSSICPICSRIDAFREPIPNFQAWELAKELSGKINELKCWDDEEELTSGPCSKCSEHSHSLRLYTECAEKEGLIRRFGENWILKAKSADNRKELLKLKSLAMCANCVIDKMDHCRKPEKLKDVLKGNVRLMSDLRKNSVQERFEQISIYLEQEKDWKKAKGEKIKISRNNRRSMKLYREIGRIRKECQRIRRENSKIRMKGLGLEEWNMENEDHQIEVTLSPEDIQDIDKKVDKRIKEMVSMGQFVAEYKENIEKIKKKEKEVMECQEKYAKRKKIYEDVQRFDEPKLIEKAEISMLRSNISMANAFKSGEEVLQKGLIYILMMLKFIQALSQPWKHSEYSHLLIDPSPLTQLLQSHFPGVQFPFFRRRRILRGILEDGPPGKCVRHPQTKKQRRRNRDSFTVTRHFTLKFQ